MTNESCPTWGLRTGRRRGLVLSASESGCRGESPSGTLGASRERAAGEPGGTPPHPWLCSSWARTTGGLGFCTFHVASFRIEIHLKWFGFFSSPPGVCCREIPSNTDGAARCLSLSVFRGTQRGHIKLNVFIRDAPAGHPPCCCSLGQGFLSPTRPPSPLQPQLTGLFSGRTRHLCFSEQTYLEGLEATEGPPILYGPPACSS